MQQETLTQMNFVSPEDAEYVDLDDEDEAPHESVKEPAKGSRRKTMGDEVGPGEKPRGGKRRKTMGDTPSMSASSSFHTQTLTQFLSNKDEGEEPWELGDSEADEDLGFVMETPRKAKKDQSLDGVGLRATEEGPDQCPGSQNPKPATPSNRQRRTEIPSSESPATTPMLMRYSPPGQTKSPLMGKSTNATAPPSILRSAHKKSRNLVIQDTYSSTYSSPNSGTPTPKAAVKFDTPKKLRFNIPEDKENITPGRTKPKSPKPLRKTPARQPLREVPDSDAEDGESIADFDPGPAPVPGTELEESESTDGPPESPTPMGNLEEAETCYGLLGDETQAEILSSDHFHDRSLDAKASASNHSHDDTVVEAPQITATGHIGSDVHATDSPLTPVVEQSPASSPLTQDSDKNVTPRAAEANADTQYTQGLESQRLPLEAIHAMGPQTLRSDIMVSLHPEHLAKIVDGTKNHEFRPWKIPAEVSRVWLYATKPFSELRYMCIFGLPKEPGQVEDEKGVGNKAFNQGRTISKYAHEVLQVYELNDPISLQEMVRKGWVKGAPQKYNYVPPAVVGELTANLRCALFEERDEAQRVGGTSNVTESQEIRAQIQGDVAYETQHPSSELAEEVIPSSQRSRKSAARRDTREEAGAFAKPVLPKPSSGGATQGGSSHASQRQNSLIRPSQATTVTQMSSSPAVTPEKSLPRPITISSDASVELHSSSPPGEQRRHHSLRSSQLLTRSQMLPESLLNDETREPPPIIWDSADEESD
ncbi:hypothetical protein DL764_010391 [Monosporascus ibericus]|uniref:Uncharacterized protein n=1 Tax=Monosporascus ibericus TaxID=155417 RepID=A0A4Q4SVF0_9PEZI|nr:hypothetical protein DL764_010391 [Monosporascus ibericus]